MMNSKFSSWCFLVSIGILLYFLFVKEEEEIIIEKTTIDTVWIERVDTTEITNLIADTVTVIDTIYIETNNQPILPLILKQHYYSKKGLYDIWLSGYNAKLDSAKVYNTTKIEVIERNTTKEIVSNKTEFLILGHLNGFGATLYPSVGIGIITKKKWLYEANIGLLGNGTVYGVSVGYLINRK